MGKLQEELPPFLFWRFGEKEVKGPVVRSRISLGDVPLKAFLGVQDRNLMQLRALFQDVQLVVRGEDLMLRGPEARVRLVEQVVDVLKRRLLERGELEEADVVATVHAVSAHQHQKNRNAGGAVIHTPKKKIQPLTPQQARYLEAIETHDVVFGVGPAGTGKTFLAVAMALKFLWEERVERIVLTRPAVEAGESLGYLPGSFEEKIHPYLIPLYDALQAMVPFEKVQTMMHRRIIEIAPLAYMRGRTLSDAFIILDEAQNTKTVQMKMFLTRIGPRSRVVITGDITQIDLPRRERSGLVEAVEVLQGVPGIAIVRLTQADVVRHPLVKRIVDAYERARESTSS